MRDAFQEFVTWGSVAVAVALYYGAQAVCKGFDAFMAWRERRQERRRRGRA